MTNKNDLIFLAGHNAWERIQDAGLHPEDVAVWWQVHPVPPSG